MKDWVRTLISLKSEERSTLRHLPMDEVGKCGGHMFVNFARRTTQTHATLRQYSSSTVAGNCALWRKMNTDKV